MNHTATHQIDKLEEEINDLYGEFPRKSKGHVKEWNDSRVKIKKLKRKIVEIKKQLYHQIVENKR